MMKIRSGETLLAILFLLGNGCAKSSRAPNFALGMTGTPLYGYSGEVFTTLPEFTVYELKSTLTPFVEFSDSVTIAAFADNLCTEEAAGTLTVETNPATLEAGVASFPNIFFTWPGDPTLEGFIYFQGSLVSNNSSYCGIRIPVIQHF